MVEVWIVLTIVFVVIFLAVVFSFSIWCYYRNKNTSYMDDDREVEISELRARIKELQDKMMEFQSIPDTQYRNLLDFLRSLQSQLARLKSDYRREKQEERSGIFGSCMPGFGSSALLSPYHDITPVPSMKEQLRDEFYKTVADPNNASAKQIEDASVHAPKTVHYEYEPRLERKVVLADQDRPIARRKTPYYAAPPVADELERRVVYDVESPRRRSYSTVLREGPAQRTSRRFSIVSAGEYPQESSSTPALAAGVVERRSDVRL